MRLVAASALLFVCACRSTAVEQPFSPPRRHHVTVTSDDILLVFVEAHRAETIDQLVINVTQNTNRDRTPIDLAPLPLLKSVQALSLSGFTVGLTDRQVEAIGQIRALRRLELRGCSLTGHQRTLLKAAVPQCEIREN